MKFRGTKNPIIKQKNKHGFGIGERNDDVVITVWGRSEESEANALLISKSKKILDKLRETMDLLESYPTEQEMHLKATEIRQLIKESTEI